MKIRKNSFADIFNRTIMAFAFITVLVSGGSKTILVGLVAMFVGFFLLLVCMTIDTYVGGDKIEK